ncbi:MAG: hypothetical protein RIR91_368 [Verrucomicrobiota bacterium]|jgi:hypothetical protein
MAYINKGNSLTALLLQAGYNVRNDGYGLWTGKCTFLLDKSMTGASLPVARGDSHPDATYAAFMTANNIEVVHGKNSICTVNVDYVGISEDGYAPSTTTGPNVSGAVSTSSESIETHPNFFEATIGTDVIAGVGTGTTTAPIYEASTFKAKTSDAATLYKGDNGAHFTQKTGGQFVGFLDPAFPLYYGRKSYLAPQTGFSGVIYTTDSTIVTDMKDATGRSSRTRDWNGNLPDLLPSYLGTTFESTPIGSGAALPQLLLASVNFEDYGLNVKKISYTIRFNAEGWVGAVNPEL